MSNSKNTTVTVSGGVGFCGALTILFIALKLCGVINWHWAWVLAPLWVGPAILIVGFLALLALAIVSGAACGIVWLIYLAVSEYRAKTHLNKVRAELAGRASKGR
jgi:hypothetical protein